MIKLVKCDDNTILSLITIGDNDVSYSVIQNKGNRYIAFTNKSNIIDGEIINTDEEHVVTILCNEKKFAYLINSMINDVYDVANSFAISDSYYSIVGYNFPNTSLSFRNKAAFTKFYSFVIKTYSVDELKKYILTKKSNALVINLEKKIKNNTAYWCKYINENDL